MKHLILIVLVITPFIGLSQEESNPSKNVSALFEQYYNADEYEKIFELFSPQMKGFLPLDKTKATTQTLKMQVGKIKSREFIKYQNGSYAIYKTTFERGILSLKISLNDEKKIDGLLVKPYQEPVTTPAITKNQTQMTLPFKGEWTVIWGGDTREQNYHVDYGSQKYAFDIVITDDAGKSFKDDGTSNEDYYAFGRELFAPCNAEVVLVVDGVKDNKPHEMNPAYVPGNTVILKTDNNEYLFFAHFKQHSIVVKQGQKIKQGTLLGLCGNSGNSSEPHLHFHIQNTEDINNATGTKCYFDELVVNGKSQKSYSPIKGDKIKSE